MNEELWLRSSDPLAMLGWIRDKTSPRKLRLLSCACCRRVWPLLSDARSRIAVEVAERYADGQASVRDLAQARARAVCAVGGGRQAAWAAYWAANTSAMGPLINVFTAASSGAADMAASGQGLSDRNERYESAVLGQAREQTALIREVIGNPFRDIVLRPDWLGWAGGTVRSIARGIYDEDAFDRMPVMGDALEDAGCGDEEVLHHCRHGQHVRGCWVLDLILDHG